MLQIMLPLSHICQELDEQRRMCGHNKRLADDLAAGGCSAAGSSQSRKKAKKGGGSGGGSGLNYHYDEGL
jgi:hypothetical protein